jgi:chemotaxis protein MotB
MTESHDAHAGGKHHKKGHGDHEEHEEHVNHEAWVIPYADLLTLLLAMFLALWATSQADKAKQAALQEAYRETVGGSLIGEGGENIIPGSESAERNLIDFSLPETAAAAQQALEEKQAEQAATQKENEVLTGVEDVVREAAEAAGLGDKVSFKREERGLVVSIVSDQVLFSSARAELLEPGLRILDGIVPALKSAGKPIAIEGHTDSRPVSGRYPSNWELSTARATSVLRYMQTRWEFPAERLTASGYADTKPIASNDTAEGQDRNRRVEIVVLSTVSR